MKSKVWYCPVENGESVPAVKNKLARLIDASKVLACVGKKELAAVKLHFGEEGNTGHVDPEYVGVICGAIAGRGALPFFSDTNTLYKGRRTKSSDHIQLAYEHGFTPQNIHAEIDIPDDDVKENTVEVPVHGKFIHSAKIALPYVTADALVGVAHFKGHLLTGFGGAVKNIGMGCATRQGKLAQHSDLAPVVTTKKCNACASCIQVCPVKAITLKDGKAFVDSAKCIGCASCIAACKFYAMEVDWEAGGERVPQKMVEYASAVLVSKKGKTAFFNFATRITAECDCLAKNDPSIAPDTGIFASCDPVAIDKASYDLVLKKAGKDVFAEVHPKRGGFAHLEYAAQLGLGSLDYELEIV